MFRIIYYHYIIHAARINSLLVSQAIMLKKLRFLFFFFFLQAGLKPAMSSRLIAPAPVASQGHLPGSAKVPGHITVTLESSMSPASIPVATISGQQVGPVHTFVQLRKISNYPLS